MNAAKISPDRDPCVLVVDDVAANREIAGVVLRAARYDVDLAASADEALEAISAKRYDVVLMDVQMPDRDGLDATRAIRALGGDAGATPVIALTAHVADGLIKVILAAGCDDHVSKPFDFEQLRDRVAFWARRAS